MKVLSLTQNDGESLTDSKNVFFGVQNLGRLHNLLDNLLTKKGFSDTSE
jgi:hypothetical protein